MGLYRAVLVPPRIFIHTYIYKYIYIYVDIGVYDPPELWCGAAGLCARLRACAGAAESLHTYTYIGSFFCIYKYKVISIAYV